MKSRGEVGNGNRPICHLMPISHTLATLNTRSHVSQTSRALPGSFSGSVAIQRKV
jgi:hypothetical protein